jgi:hypothetical protein
MTPAERDYAAAYLERTKSSLLAATAALTEEQWRFKPSSEEWCAAECVEHIALVEAFLLDTIAKLAAGPPAPAEILATCAGKEAIVEQKVPVRNVKVKAPEQARPTNRFANSADLIAHFIATRDRSIEYARTTTDDIRRRTHPHFVFGPMDGYQWLIFMAAHGERHLNQLLEVTGRHSAAASRPTQTGL